MKSAKTYITEHKQRFLDELIELLKIPSISADSAYKGDVIKTDTLHKSVNEFMKGVRVGKLNHQGEQVGQILHSFPMTKGICEALGIQSDKEGWITGYHVTNDALWDKVKSGEYAEFSIGGRAQKQEF